MPEGRSSGSLSLAMGCANLYLDARAAEKGLSVGYVQSLRKAEERWQQAHQDSACIMRNINDALVNSDWQLQGVCFHLYSKARSSGLAEYQLPELQRSPLDELSLQARLHAAWHWVSLLL